MAMRFASGSRRRRPGLLALLGIDADPVRSREHILLSNVFETSWRDGPRSRLVAVDPANSAAAVRQDRRGRPGIVLSGEGADAAGDELNNLLASPSFASWMEGEPLDISRDALHAGGQAAAGDRVDRPSGRRRADVLRDDPAQRSPGLDAHAAGHEQPAGDALHGRSVRLLSADRPIRRRSGRC